jgi:hypothetical protein
LQLQRIEINGGKMIIKAWAGRRGDGRFYSLGYHEIPIFWEKKSQVPKWLIPVQMVLAEDLTVLLQEENHAEKIGETRETVKRP